MRLSSGGDGDEARALATIAAAVAAGTTVFDTAHAYDTSPEAGPRDPGGNERLLARALQECGAADRARIVTKGGMDRSDGGWRPDGRARTIRAHCEASLTALDGLPIDLYLLHAPDPRTSWATSVRALGRLVTDGLVARVGLANVTRAQLDEALTLAPVSAVQVALSPLDDTALRSGLLDRCAEAGVTVMAHSPLGGPRRARALQRDGTLVAVADRYDATPAQVALSWLLTLDPRLVVIPGARHPEAARTAVDAADLRLDDTDRHLLDTRFGRSSRPRLPPGARPGPAPVVPASATATATAGAEVVLVMGIPGAGKTRAVGELVAQGHHRLNRDERGGTLKDLAADLDAALTAGARAVVLDNTYLTRAARSHVIDVAHRHGAAVHCRWLDTPLDQAQINLVLRLIDQHGSLPDPDELRLLARRLPGVLTPTAQMRAHRQLEPPTDDEGFTSIERVPFQRAATEPSLTKPGPGPEPGAKPEPAGRRPGVFVAAAALTHPGWPAEAARVTAGTPHLVFDWRPDGSAADLAEPAARLAALVDGPVEAALCPHPGGPPTCWCRPPLPGLLLAFAHRHGVDPAWSILIGTSATHRALATALGATLVSV